MTAKEHVEQLATILQGPKEYIPDGDNQKIPLNALWHISNLEKQGMIQTVNEKTFIHLQPENEVYRFGTSEPMTQDEFVEYTAGLKQPQKPTGLLAGFREWFHKYIHTLRDFAEYDHKVKEYEVKKYDICKDAGLDVSDKDETIEQYRREVEEKNQKDLAAAEEKARVAEEKARIAEQKAAEEARVAEQKAAEKNQKDLVAAMNKIRRTCRNGGLVDCDRLVNSFENAVKADWEVGKHLMEAIPKLDMMGCKDLQWKVNSTGVDTHIGFGSLGTSAGNSISDREMKISDAVSFMHVCKGYLPPELQAKVEAKYAEEKEPYMEYKKQMQALMGTSEASKLYHKWKDGIFKKEYWANKNAVQVEANVEMKPSEMPKDKLLEYAQKNTELVKAEMQNEQKQGVSEKAAELGLGEQQVQQAIDTANNGANVAVNAEAGLEQPQPDEQLQQEQPKMGMGGME